MEPASGMDVCWPFGARVRCTSLASNWHARRPRASMKVGLPIRRDPSSRSRDRLIEWVVPWRRERRSVEVLPAPVVVEPLFARLVARDDGMARRPSVLRSVLRRRVVAAADMPALGTSPKVEPPAAGSLTLRTTRSTRGHCRIDRIERGITVRRGHAPSLRVGNAGARSPIGQPMIPHQPPWRQRLARTLAARSKREAIQPLKPVELR
jgi:hypothetical protein